MVTNAIWAEDDQPKFMGCTQGMGPPYKQNY